MILAALNILCDNDCDSEQHQRSNDGQFHAGLFHADFLS